MQDNLKAGLNQGVWLSQTLLQKGQDKMEEKILMKK